MSVMGLPVMMPRWVRLLPVIALAAVAVAGSGRYVSGLLRPGPVVVAAPGFAVEPHAYHPAKLAHATPPVAAGPVPAGALGRLVIPSLKVNSVARPVGLSGGAIDITPNIWDVGVFTGAALPGQPGNAVIEGHLDWTTGPAVFWNLHALHAGDEVDFVRADGGTYRFAVSAMRNLPYTTAAPRDLFSRTGAPSVTLITCSGAWNRGAHSYTTRLLVTATQI